MTKQTVNLKPINPAERDDFRVMVEAYWQELMPHASVIHDEQRRADYFRECFTWGGGNRHSHWALNDFLFIPLSIQSSTCGGV